MLAQPTGIFIGAFPIEEATFFLPTGMLVVSGLTLLLAAEGRVRASATFARLARQQAE